MRCLPYGVTHMYRHTAGIFLFVAANTMIVILWVHIHVLDSCRVPHTTARASAPHALSSLDHCGRLYSAVLTWPLSRTTTLHLPTPLSYTQADFNMPNLELEVNSNGKGLYGIIR